MRRRRSNRTAASQMGASLASIARIGQELTPYPAVFTPPSDPPTVRRNPVKELCLDLEAKSPSGGIYTMSVGSLRNRITEHTSLNKPAFVLRWIGVWAASGNYSLRLVEHITQVTAYDDGGFAHRARCGIRYSKNIQKLYTPADTGTIFSIVTATDDPAPVLRCGVDYWDAEPNG